VRNQGFVGGYKFGNVHKLKFPPFLSRVFLFLPENQRCAEEICVHVAKYHEIKSMGRLLNGLILPVVLLIGTEQTSMEI